MLITEPSKIDLSSCQCTYYSQGGGSWKPLAKSCASTPHLAVVLCQAENLGKRAIRLERLQALHSARRDDEHTCTMKRKLVPCTTCRQRTDITSAGASHRELLLLPSTFARNMSIRQSCPTCTCPSYSGNVSRQRAIWHGSKVQCRGCLRNVHSERSRGGVTDGQAGPVVRNPVAVGHLRTRRHQHGNRGSDRNGTFIGELMRMSDASP